jgi:hypothetical protein
VDLVFSFGLWTLDWFFKGTMDQVFLSDFGLWTGFSKGRGSGFSFGLWTWTGFSKGCGSGFSFGRWTSFSF